MKHVLSIAAFEARLTLRMIRVWVLGIIALLSGIGTLGYYVFIHRVFSGFTGPASYIVREFGLIYSGLMGALMLGLFAMFFVFDWRHRDRTSRFTVTYDGSEVTPLALAWGKFLGLTAPIFGFFLLLIPFQIIASLIADLRLPLSAYLMGDWWLGLMAALPLPAMAFGIAAALRSRALAIIVPIVWFAGILSLAFWAQVPEWVIAMLGGLTEIPIYSEFVGYQVDPIFWLQRVSIIAQVVAFVSLGALGSWAPARHAAARARTRLLVLGSFLVLILSFAASAFLYLRGVQAAEAVVTAESVVAGAEEPRVIERELEAWLEDDATLRGQARLRVKNDTMAPLSELSLRLNMGLEVSELRVDGQAVTPTRDQTVLRFNPPSPLPSGAEAELELSYQGNVEVLAAGADTVLSTVEMKAQDRGNRRFIGTIPSFHEKGSVVLPLDSAWYPQVGMRFGHEFPSHWAQDLAPGRLTVHLPDGWKAASVGRRESNGDGFVFTVDEPTPGHALVAGPYDEIETEVAGLTLRLLHHPKHGRNMEYFASTWPLLEASIEERLDEIEATTGLQPAWPELTAVEVPQQFAAYEGDWRARNRMAAPGLVMMREGGLFLSHFDFAQQVNPDSGKASSEGGNVRITIGNQPDEDADEGVRFGASVGDDEPSSDEDSADASADGEAEAGVAEADADVDADAEESEASEEHLKQAALLRFLRTDWLGGDVERLAFTSVYDHRVRAEDEAAPLLSVALSQVLFEMAHGRPSFDHPASMGILNDPAFAQVITAMIEGKDVIEPLLRGVVDFDVVHEQIRSTALSELDPTDLGLDYLGVLHVKGRQPFNALRARLGRERFKQVVDRCILDAEDGLLTWREFEDATLASTPDELKTEVTELLGGWLSETDLPGFIVSSVRTQRLPGEDERWQLLARVSNRGQAAGVAELFAGRGPDAPSRVFRLEKGAEVEIGMVLPERPRGWRLEPFLALNRHAPSGDARLVKNEATDPAFEGERPPTDSLRELRFEVDDQDDGFVVTLEDGREVTTSQRDDEGENLLDDWPGFRQPKEWARWRPQSGGWFKPYGLFDITAVVRRGDEESAHPARWSTPLEAGRYQVEVHLPKRGKGMSAQLAEEMKYRIGHASGEQELGLEMDAVSNGWNDLGRFDFDGEARVWLLDGVEGLIIADAVRFTKESS